MKEQMQQNSDFNRTKTLGNEMEKYRYEIGNIFDTCKNGEERFNAIFSKIRIFVDKGIVDKDKFLSDIKECSKAEDREEFINRAFIILEPILEIQKNNPKLIEEIKAEAFVEQGKYTKINEVLSYGFGDRCIHIHLAPSKELLREIGKDNYLNLIKDGFKELAKIVEKDDNIDEIVAVSPVVTNNPNRLTEFHFTIAGPIDKEDKEKHWGGETREISAAYIPRGKFLSEYLNK